MAAKFLWVDPAILRLPNSRIQGADPWKLQLQIARYGKSVAGMPRLEVWRDKNDELLVVNGVTRATRVAKFLQGTLVEVEVTHEKPNSDFSRQPTVKEKLP